MRDTLRRVATAATAAGTVLALTVGPASAASPLDRWQFHDEGSGEWGCWFVPPEGPEEEWPDPDYVLAYDYDISGSGSFQQRGGPSTGPGFHERVRGTETWTLVGDPTTTADDHVYVHTFANNLRDARVVVEDPGVNGTLLITGFAAGNDTLWVDGERMRDPGHVVYQFRVHHNGTLDNADDDYDFEFLGFLKESTGLNEADEYDPCVLLGAFLP
jgi:hypothetical protein